MNRNEHLKVDKFCFNKESNDVHQWLDETYKYYMNTNPYKHWLERHHIEAISKKYGNYTPEYNVAYFHILFDYISHFNVAFVPQDRKEAESMLKSLKSLKGED